MRFRTFGFAYFLLGPIVSLRAAPLVAKTNQVGGPEPGGKEVIGTTPDLSNNPNHFTERINDPDHFMNDNLQSLLAQIDQVADPGDCCPESRSKEVRTTIEITNSPSHLTENLWDETEHSINGDIQPVVASVPGQAIGTPVVLIPREKKPIAIVYGFKEANSEVGKGDTPAVTDSPPDELIFHDRKTRAKKYLEDLHFRHFKVEVRFGDEKSLEESSRAVGPKIMGAPFKIEWGWVEKSERMQDLVVPKGAAESFRLEITVISFTLSVPFIEDESRPAEPVIGGVPNHIEYRVRNHFSQQYPSDYVHVKYEPTARYVSTNPRAAFQIWYTMGSPDRKKMDGSEVLDSNSLRVLKIPEEPLPAGR
ncbi:hypothetical protein FB446DRAFT_718328 [Lentinula raphanica]|nr:hypothetical protein FB446DRAFT_718328 [Lentinula raphanica]